MLKPYTDFFFNYFELLWRVRRRQSRKKILPIINKSHTSVQDDQGVSGQALGGCLPCLEDESVQLGERFVDIIGQCKGQRSLNEVIRGREGVGA